MYSQDPITISKFLFNFFKQSEQILNVYLMLHVFVKAAIWLFENKFVIRCQIQWTVFKNSNIFWIFQVPEETCNLTPKKQCKHVTRLVPNLKPVEDCIDVSSNLFVTSKNETTNSPIDQFMNLKCWKMPF